MHVLVFFLKTLGKSHLQPFSFKDIGKKSSQASATQLIKSYV